LDKFDFLEVETDASISFHIQDVPKPPVDEIKCEEWLLAVTEEEKKTVSTVNIIFVSDEALLKMNIEHLAHDYYTDIITFDYSDTSVEGDLYISIDRVQDNALQLQQTYEEELHRVIVHGVLHLIGYGDKTDTEAKTMRSKESYYLNQR